jgi:D-psicose/D-tagatose/L-ribulose 3-epimerase
MKLAVSSIAWTNEEEVLVAESLRMLGVKYVEIAPTKKWNDPPKASADEIAAYKGFWQAYGIEVVAFQSMLFTRPDLKIFESEENRQQTLTYLTDFIGLAGNMGVSVMVFGSPKNRQRGEMSLEEATPIAKEFFNSLGDAAKQQNVSFCIEPNPPNYSCDFITTASDGIKLVSEVNNRGFGLHLDIAGMTLAGDDVAKSIQDGAHLLRHFHISSPNLDQVEDLEQVHHREAADALRAINYDGYVSIEMRPGAVGDNVSRVEKAVRFAQSIYGD